MHYNQRIIEVAHGCFSLLVFTPHAGSEREAESFLVELEHKVSEKKYMRFDTVIGWLRAKLPFNILRSSVLSMRSKSTMEGV